MSSIRKRKKTRVLPLILAAALCFSNHFTFAVNAENATQTKQKLEDDLSKLNNDKKTVSDDLSAATASLQSTLKEIETAQQELGAARARAVGQYELMKRRIKYIYESSSGNFMSMLLEAESMSDLLNKADFISAVSEYDRTMLENFKQLQKDIEQKEQALLEQQKTLTAQKKSLAAKYNELASMITDKSNDLAAYEKQLAEAKAAAEAAEALKKQENNNSNSKPVEKPQNPSEKPSKPNKPSVPSDTTDLALFAAILQCEAISSDYNALLAVATVIMNRVESPRYPNTLSGVIYQKGQFSPTWEGKLDTVLAKGPKALCYTVAKDALAGARHDAVRHCYSFRMARPGLDGITIGDNTFF